MTPSTITITNPYNQQVLQELPYHSDAQLQELLAEAERAQSAWQQVTLEERIERILLALDALESQGESIARDVTLQMGKPIGQSRREMATMLDRARQSIADAPAALAPDHLPDKEGFIRRIHHEPLGIVLNIAAWNYPLVIPINVIVPALLAGNVVLLKHSHRTVLTSQALAAAFETTGQSGLLTSLVTTREQTMHLIGDRRVAYVAFTGSVGGGEQIYRAVASSRLIDVGLELGGKDPAYVAADAELDFAVANLVDGACSNAGQSCCAIERVYVHHDLYEPFLFKAAEIMSEYRLGDPLQEETTMGPLARRGGLAELQQQVDDAVDRGARLMLGGQRLAGTEGNFYPPTLLSDVPHDALVMREESFGPLLPIAPVENDDEALHWMNESQFGLSASVWTADNDRAERFGEELRAGTIYQNRCDYLDPMLPWTGWADSGKGSTLSRFGFYQLTRRKSIHFRVEQD
jgi:acyl-CoA reductase-like NAD-dependent aldehyde dehydrogenase